MPTRRAVGALTLALAAGLATGGSALAGEQPADGEPVTTVTEQPPPRARQCYSIVTPRRTIDDTTIIVDGLPCCDTCVSGVLRLGDIELRQSGDDVFFYCPVPLAPAQNQ